MEQRILNNPWKANGVVSSNTLNLIKKGYFCHCQINFDNLKRSKSVLTPGYTKPKALSKLKYHTYPCNLLSTLWFTV